MRALITANVCGLALLALSACTRDRAPAHEPRVLAKDSDGIAANRGVDRDGDGDVDRDGDGDGDRDTALRPASRTGSATEAIAQARCAREQRCNNIGNDEKFSSSGDCLTSIRNDWKDDLNARECPGGVEQDDLQECLTEIRNEDCNSPFDTLERISACTAAQICDDDAND